MDRRGWWRIQNTLHGTAGAVTAVVWRTSCLQEDLEDQAGIPSGAKLLAVSIEMVGIKAAEPRSDMTSQQILQEIGNMAMLDHPNARSLGVPLGS